MGPKIKKENWGPFWDEPIPKDNPGSGLGIFLGPQTRPEINIKKKKTYYLEQKGYVPSFLPPANSA